MAKDKHTIASCILAIMYVHAACPSTSAFTPAIALDGSYMYIQGLVSGRIRLAGINCSLQYLKTDIVVAHLNTGTRIAPLLHHKFFI